MAFSIYVLRLEGDKYYVGKAVDPVSRFEKHVQGKGSRWTKRYSPLEMIEVYQTDNPFDEDKTTKEYMSKYGIDNVRGGTYVGKKISDGERIFLEKEIRMAKGLCTFCGGSHLVRFCKNRDPM
jgi:cellular nucleic acid-binding protein